MCFTVANERRFAMGRPVRLREDYTAAQVRGLARRSHDAGQTRRLLALAAIYDGGSRSAAAKIGGGGGEKGRGWGVGVHGGGAPGVVNREAPGKGPLLGCDK